MGGGKRKGRSAGTGRPSKHYYDEQEHIMSLRPVVRRILPAAPLVEITAPTPGTGKTLLAETISIVMSTGQRDVDGA
jgi:hypothetical protein